MPTPIHILDGALGTLLCDTTAPSASVSPLWSSLPLLSSPSTIKTIHEKYLASGADIISTATYQLTHKTLELAGVTDPEEINRLYALGINLAVDAAAEAGRTSRGSQIALSLGPFGASLQPSQEYSGIYPAPFDIESGEKALEELAKWHTERLQMFVRSDGFENIDYVAFETTPMNRVDEIVAIRRAIKEIGLEKRWWISMVFPENPQQSLVKQLVQEVFCGSEDTSHVPWGIGINCTKPQLLRDIISVYSAAVREMRVPKNKNFLVLYPDGGLTYDVNTKTWSDEVGLADAYKWANGVIETAKEAAETNTWGDIIVGGCCKTGPEHVTAIQKILG